MIFPLLAESFPLVSVDDSEGVQPADNYRKMKSEMCVDLFLFLAQGTLECLGWNEIKCELRQSFRVTSFKNFVVPVVDEFNRRWWICEWKNIFRTGALLKRKKMWIYSFYSLSVKIGCFSVTMKHQNVFHRCRVLCASLDRWFPVSIWSMSQPSAI